MGTKELNIIWEVLHTYREGRHRCCQYCVPDGDDILDEEWDDICYAMARIKEMLECDLCV